ncbi:MAG: hypothetical protein ABJQ70_12160 [Roseobacter sp.]
MTRLTVASIVKHPYVEWCFRETATFTINQQENQFSFRLPVGGVGGRVTLRDPYWNY